MALFKGSGVAIITPFTSDDQVNYDVFGSLIDFHITSGTAAIIVSGTTGESATLSKAEKLELFRFSVEYAKGRIQIIAGTGSNNTKESIELSKEAETIGVDGLLLVTPYYNKPTQEGLFAHYKAIADAVSIPIILYNVPGRTSINLLPETVVRLAAIPNIQAIKEASHDLVQIKELFGLIDSSFIIYSGNDDQTQEILEMGGLGVISVTANVDPKRVADQINYYFSGHVDKARQIGNDLIEFHESMFVESNPVPAKTLLRWMGYEVGSVRLPLVELQPESAQKLRSISQEFGVIK
jgi:4-hydroxy-tetrahydrodipicolinate synthase